jgi:hypothetical protein
VPFPYLLRAHVKLYYGLSLQSGGYTQLLADGVNYTWTSDTQVQVSAAPVVGQTLSIRRETPTTSRLVDWNNGSAPTADALDTADLQNFYAIQEHKDYIEALGINPNTNVTDGSITANKLSSDAVTTIKIQDAAVTSGKIQDGAVVSSKIQDDAVTTIKIQDAAVTSSKIQDGAVTNGKIQDGAVTSGKIQDGAIVNADVNASAGIVASKLAFTQSGTGATVRTVDSKLKDVVSAKDYGAVGDGVTDDYNAIKKAVAALQTAGSGTLFFPKGTYFIDQYKIDGGPSANGIVDFALQNLNNVCISGYGATLVMKGGWTRTADYSSSGFTFSYSNSIGFVFTDCTNLTVEGLEVDGGANTIVKQATAEGASYGVVLNGCTQVSLRDLYIHHCCTDGLRVDMSGPITAFKVSRQVYASNCRFNNNGRQGMSLIQLRHATFTNCDFSFTGTTGTYGGHSPMAGVDIEPNFAHDNPTTPLNAAGNDSTGDISFIGCRFKDNNGFEFVGTSRDTVQHPVQFFDCLFQNTNNSAPQVVTATRLTRFYSCSFDDVALYPGYTLNDDNQTELHGCRIISRRPTAYAILHAQANPTLIVDRCDIQLRAPTSSAGTYRLYITAPKCEFTNNRVFIAATEHGSATFQLHSLLQGVRKSTGNRFSTDLVTASKLFGINFDTASIVNDFFEQPTYISPSSGPWPINEYVLPVVNPYTVAFGYKSGAITSVIFEFVSDSSGGSCIAEIAVAGFNLATKVVVGRYADQAPIVMQNTGGQTITTSSSANGGLKVEIAISVTHPCVTATATVGGLARNFSTFPVISFV